MLVVISGIRGVRADAHPADRVYQILVDGALLPLLATIDLRWRAAASCDATTLTDVEDLGVVLQPVQVAGHLLGDVALAPCGEADHDDDELGPNISLRDPTVW